MTILTRSDYIHKALGKLNMHTNRATQLQEEAAMIELAKSDIQHFEGLYNRYFEQIFRFIFRKTDDESAAGDLTQKVFMKAMDALPKYEFRNVPFAAWLYKIASNETNKYFRDTKKHFLSLENEKVNLVMHCDELDSDEDRLAVLRDLINELDDDEIQILELKYFENKNFTEIAFILDRSESAVKMRMYRSLNKLRDKYKNLLDQD